MKKLNSNFIPVSKSLANAAASGALEQLAVTAGASLSGGGGGGGTSYDQAATSTGVLGLPVGNTANRSNVEGGIRVNSQEETLEIYYSNTWVSIGNITTGITATGGDTIITSGNYKIHVFQSSGTFNVLSAPEGSTVEYLIVAGGGGGGGSGYAQTRGGGGGAGGFKTGTAPISVAPYTITVGAGGAGGATLDSTNIASGSDSSAFNITSTGGGYGGSYSSKSAVTGGSGGGGGTGGPAGATGAAGTPGQGNSGGNGVGYSNGTGTAAGGGGGSSSAGSNGSGGTGGTGGQGTASLITGIETYYAGGGGGGGGVTGASGGLGGGGPGGSYSQNGTNGTSNTGGGGGGSSSGATNPDNGTGGSGGSGVVIIKYQYKSSAFTERSPDITAVEVGTTAERVGVEGAIRINSDTNYLEIFHSNTWATSSYVGTSNGGQAFANFYYAVNDAAGDLTIASTSGEGTGLGTKMLFNTVGPAINITPNVTTSTWTHNLTGTYMVACRYRQHAGGDLWTALAVTKDGPSNAVGVSARTGSENSHNERYDIVYTVDSTSSTYQLQHWVQTTTKTVFSDFTGEPAWTNYTDLTGNRTGDNGRMVDYMIFRLGDLPS